MQFDAPLFCRAGDNVFLVEEYQGIFVHCGRRFHRTTFVQVVVMAWKAIRPPKKDREWPPVILQLLADPDPVSQRCARLLVERMPITCGVVRAVNRNPKGEGLADLG